MKQVDINDISNYKACYKKDYSVYACIPESDTIIINRFNNPELYVRLGKKDFFTAEQVHKHNLLQKYSEYIQNGQLQVVKDSCICLYGTVGELQLISIREFVNTYTFENNQQITSQNIDRLGDNWCVVTPIKPMLDIMYSACFVPKIQIEHLGRMTVNDSYVNHGKGDFIVCDSINGKPNMNTRRVVNGLIFANTYNNQGWTNCISSAN